MESARIIAGIARIVRDVGIAEELAQDALVAALSQWPESGIPQNPGAWLMTAAKHRAIDPCAATIGLGRKHEELGREIEGQRQAHVEKLDEAMDDEFGDDLLRLMFVACHPVLSTEARVALTLRLIGGLTTGEIARVPGARGDDRAAYRACQTNAHRKADTVRDPSWSRVGASVFRRCSKSFI